MHVLVTVGATVNFDLLVEAVLEQNCLKALYQKGYRELSIQIGHSQRYQELQEERNGLIINTWSIKPSLVEDIQKANLVISHAGSGTILDVLRLHKPLIVVPNPTLLHNHQLELADALQKRGYLIATTFLYDRHLFSLFQFETNDTSDLPTTIARLEPEKLLHFPEFDSTKFSSLLDEIMGFD
ncbi:hypothetical protein Clacol_006391 [Clathrus columnatus]|uniref:UDP-N-acetylglucosamine transferase subunit ALG13 n=1 Tax=Clathrus columnatus TaxID=1419009 RepID=A0AAV5ACR0_9AGAM|nr:hypothetical protein Clacol_006391 [Clathrus columnatus]